MADSLNLDTIKPGQDIRCTITSEPRTENRRQTIARLMRRDPANKRALRNAQRIRRQRMNIYTRGGRDWYSRERCAEIVDVSAGQSWTMSFTPDIAKDLQSVGAHISVEQNA